MIVRVGQITEDRKNESEGLDGCLCYSAGGYLANFTLMNVCCVALGVDVMLSESGQPE